jgi:hypothetical protein
VRDSSRRQAKLLLACRLQTGEAGGRVMKKTTKNSERRGLRVRTQVKAGAKKLFIGGLNSLPSNETP